MMTYLDERLEVIVTKQPGNRSVSGKLPTRYMVVDGKVKRRVYAGCYSNVASYYVLVKGVRVYVKDSVLEATKDLLLSVIRK